jgi:hypothetical protein
VTHRYPGTKSSHPTCLPTCIHTATAGAVVVLTDWSPRLGYDDAVPEHTPGRRHDTARGRIGIGWCRLAMKEMLMIGRARGCHPPPSRDAPARPEPGAATSRGPRARSTIASHRIKGPSDSPPTPLGWKGNAGWVGVGKETDLIPLSKRHRNGARKFTSAYSGRGTLYIGTAPLGHVIHSAAAIKTRFLGGDVWQCPGSFIQPFPSSFHRHP